MPAKLTHFPENPSASFLSSEKPQRFFLEDQCDLTPRPLVSSWCVVMETLSQALSSPSGWPPCRASCRASCRHGWALILYGAQADVNIYNTPTCVYRQQGYQKDPEGAVGWDCESKRAWPLLVVGWGGSEFAGPGSSSSVYVRKAGLQRHTCLTRVLPPPLLIRREQQH